MHIVMTGVNGQIAASLIERGAREEVGVRANFRLDNDKLSRTNGVVLPERRRSLSDHVDRLLSKT
jgi:hypothetical protein